MRAKPQGGQALIETILLGLLLLVPLIWALGVLSELHRGALAATSAAREAGTDAARSTNPRDAENAVVRAVRQAFEDQGLNADLARVRLSGDDDLRRGEAIEIEVAYPVSVVQAPLLGRVSGPSVWVRARHIVRIDPFRSRE